jgi:hypothetical protein
MAEANSQTADPSVHGVRISDLIIGRIFAAASLSGTLRVRRRTRRCRLRRDLRLLPTAVGHRAAFAKIIRRYQTIGTPATVIGLALHIDVLSHQSVPAMPSIGHPDCSICTHLTAEPGTIVEPGLLSITDTLCNPGRERPLPNLIRSTIPPARPEEYSMVFVAGASSIGKSLVALRFVRGDFTR